MHSAVDAGKRVLRKQVLLNQHASDDHVAGHAVYCVMEECGRVDRSPGILARAFGDLANERLNGFHSIG